MSGIGVFKGANLGAAYALVLADIKDLQVEFEPLASPSASMIVSEPLTFKSGKNFSYINFIADTSEFNFKSSQGIYNNNVNILVPQLSPEISSFLYKFEKQNFVGILIDNNNKAMVLGSSNYPISFDTDGQSGTAYAATNGYTIKFTGAQPYPHFFYLSVPQVPAPDRKVFNNGFDYGFLRTDQFE